MNDCTPTLCPSRWAVSRGTSYDMVLSPPRFHIAGTTRYVKAQSLIHPHLLTGAPSRIPQKSLFRQLRQAHFTAQFPWSLWLVSVPWAFCSVFFPGLFHVLAIVVCFPDPVMVATGHTYDRVCIEKWLHQGNRTCPVTGLRLRHMELTPNYALRTAIQVCVVLHLVQQC